MYTHQALLSASCRRRAVAARPKNMTMVEIMLLTSRSLMNKLNNQLTTSTISIHHQNSERRLRPLKSRMRLEASLTASAKPSCGNALILFTIHCSLFTTQSLLLSNRACPRSRHIGCRGGCRRASLTSGPASHRRSSACRCQGRRYKR